MIVPGLLFLATSHNVAKAYIAAMQSLDLVPERTIYLEFIPNRSNEKSYSLSRSCSCAISRVKKIENFVHSKNIDQVFRDFSGMFKDRSSCDALSPEDTNVLYHKVISSAKENGLPTCNFFLSTRELLDSFGISYECMNISSLNDPRFIDFLTHVSQSHALYVDGGILRKPALSTHVKFIHVHPGEVPYVRGSMCMFWGALVHNRIGISSFYMNEGIDTGDILLTKTYPVPRIGITGRYLNPAFDDILYHALENYLDPCFRADVLRDLLKENPNPQTWHVTSQQPGAGQVYYYMHPAIRTRAIRHFFRRIT